MLNNSLILLKKWTTPPAFFFRQVFFSNFRTFLFFFSIDLTFSTADELFIEPV